ncbi:MAG TPA: TIR domain-containing protein [Thermoanaerobaculia bacterium]|nr:TIR domain-containing protein [Thermoanaerobaculia bacterium]
MPYFFISYRRRDQEGQYLAHMICRELRRRYGEQSAFLDVDSRSPGLSFPVKLSRALSITDVVLVIIGPAWLQLLTERLGDSRDWVRYEIAESLKRSWLPVVPVCRAGVEMPQPHQLPEELKDLGWRDGVTLDPFQDFDSHLARLLRDVENVLETTTREKEELRLARWRLTVLLRWRAHQLDLAAAREAAVKLAAERAVKERAATEERAAMWAEAAKMAAQEAARMNAEAAERAAARAATSQKKAEPEPQKARETPASRLGPNPLPAAPSRSTSVPGPSVAPKGGATVVVPFRPASPPAASGTLVKTPASKYYQPSGRFTTAGVILSLFVSWLMIFVLALGYSYSLLSLPFVQANFVLTLLYGFLSGLAASFALRWCKVRSTGMAALVGLAAGLGAVHLSWAVWVFGHLDLFKTTGLLGLLDLSSSPARLWHLLRSVNETGSWGLWGYKPTGALLWLLWSLEAALIIGLSSFFAALMLDTGDIFCEACDTWCQRLSGVAKLRSCDPAELSAV